MYDELVKRLREDVPTALVNCDFDFVEGWSKEAADAIEELQATLCNWCAVCSEDKRDLSTCEIYESCRAKPPKGGNRVKYKVIFDKWAYVEADSEED